MDIRICTICNGSGIVDKSDRWDHIVETCVKCNGTGRIITKTYKYEVAFDPDKSLINKADEKICNIIRELEKQK